MTIIKLLHHLCRLNLNVFFSLLFILAANMHPIRLFQALKPFLFNTITIPTCFLCAMSNLVRLLITVCEIILALNFRFCSLSPCTVSLDDQTIMHFWVPNNRHLDKPNVALIHGYGGNSRWQFYWQVKPLSQRFNLFIPDLLFFGKSYTQWSDRSDVFQAKCVGEGMKRLGVERFSVAGISYGGYVAYRMAEIYPKEVEKVVIVSCGICYREEQKVEQLRKIGRNPLELLVPEKPEDLRSFLNRYCLYKYDPLKWVPDFVLKEIIKVIYKNNRKDISELAEYLLTQKPDSNLGILSQETLIIWGDKDKLFPINYAYQLERHLEPKAKVAIIKDTGHAVNLDSPLALNDLILSFVQKD